MQSWDRHQPHAQLDDQRRVPLRRPLHRDRRHRSLGEGRPAGPWDRRPATGRSPASAFSRTSCFTRYGSYLQTAAPPSPPPAPRSVSGHGCGAMDGDGNQWANGFFTADDVGTSEHTARPADRRRPSMRSMRRSAVQRQGVVRVDGRGWVHGQLQPRPTSAVDAQVISLALAGLNAQVGSFNKVAAPTTSQPDRRRRTSARRPCSSPAFRTWRAPTPVAHSRFGIGASDGTTEGSSAFQDQNAAAVTNVSRIDKTSKAFMKIDNTTTARRSSTPRPT